MRERGRKGERKGEKHQWVVASCTSPTGGTWPATQACALTGTRIGDPLVRRLALNSLSHTSQGPMLSLITFTQSQKQMEMLLHHLLQHNLSGECMWSTVRGHRNAARGAGGRHVDPHSQPVAPEEPSGCKHLLLNTKKSHPSIHPSIHPP